MVDTILELFQRDLENLKSEISSYKDEKLLWLTTGEVKNSAGNLCLHICGNLQHFVGSVIGNSGYLRKRDLEFSKKNIPVEKLIEEIGVTLQIVQTTLTNLGEGKLAEKYPLDVFGYEMTTGFFLTHLTTHLNYHLGQINYHRRILDN
ncbi:MAG: DinB family protein [Ignavibacteria bacterium]|nr:DinB family protein [Eudoraea sp.]MBT8378802.1 DinB family protein [Ignavibacteria bacterium]MBT8382552.1 DinB family protein [Ignavibacteria bacterium]NNJ53909.1 DinB family protein [Ignavibacteriaceae bacterium]NNL19776.1 DinB family protein [Ignavibacteriaceae bacterium]